MKYKHFIYNSIRHDFAIIDSGYIHKALSSLIINIYVTNLKSIHDIYMFTTVHVNKPVSETAINAKELQNYITDPKVYNLMMFMLLTKYDIENVEIIIS